MKTEFNGLICNNFLPPTIAQVTEKNILKDHALIHLLTFMIMNQKSKLFSLIGVSLMLNRAKGCQGVFLSELLI